jgi:F0F1-type ATP synthase assembly protein I
MKITRTFLRYLLKEAKEENECPEPTQDPELNALNKGKAAVNRKIAYMHPEDAQKILEMVEEEKLCGNCAAFDISQEMIDCGVEVGKGFGYCKMHDFSCAAEKTCLTWAPGGPKK